MAEDRPALPSDLRLALGSEFVRYMMPHRRQMALLDRVESYAVRDRKLVGIKDVAQNEPACEGHFPDEPIFPATLIIEALAQACGIIMNLEYLVEKNFRLDRVHDLAYLATIPPPPLTVLAESKIRQHRRVYPGDRIKLESHLAIRRQEMCYFKVRAVVNDTMVAEGEIMLAAPAYVLNTEESI
jgi:3-hydroxyacyl-[acyl-carrier-protein] dehydratase